LTVLFLSLPAAVSAGALEEAKAEAPAPKDTVDLVKAFLDTPTEELPADFIPEFLAVNPNNKIPAILDPNGPGGKPLPLFESGAILLYLADKAQRFMPHEAAGSYQAIQLLMFQMAGVGPMFGQVGFFHKFAGKDYEDKRPRDRYVGEAKRLLGVLDRHLAGRDWMMGADYTVADIAIFPWVNVLNTFYGAGELVGMKDFTQVNRVLEVFLARPAVVRGLDIPKRP